MSKKTKSTIASESYDFARVKEQGRVTEDEVKALITGVKQDFILLMKTQEFFRENPDKKLSHGTHHVDRTDIISLSKQFKDNLKIVESVVTASIKHKAKKTGSVNNADHLKKPIFVADNIRDMASSVFMGNGLASFLVEISTNQKTGKPEYSSSKFISLANSQLGADRATSVEEIREMLYYKHPSLESSNEIRNSFEVDSDGAVVESDPIVQRVTEIYNAYARASGNSMVNAATVAQSAVPQADPNGLGTLLNVRLNFISSIAWNPNNETKGTFALEAADEPVLFALAPPLNTTIGSAINAANMLQSYPMRRDSSGRIVASGGKKSKKGENAGGKTAGTYVPIGLVAKYFAGTDADYPAGSRVALSVNGFSILDGDVPELNDVNKAAKIQDKVDNVNMSPLEYLNRVHEASKKKNGLKPYDAGQSRALTTKDLSMAHALSIPSEWIDNGDDMLESAEIKNALAYTQSQLSTIVGCFGEYNMTTTRRNKITDKVSGSSSPKLTAKKMTGVKNSKAPVRASSPTSHNSPPRHSASRSRSPSPVRADVQPTNVHQAPPNIIHQAHTEHLSAPKSPKGSVKSQATNLLGAFQNAGKSTSPTKTAKSPAARTSRPRARQ